MKLSKANRYSAGDHSLFKILPKAKGKRLTSKEITDKFYKGKVPLNGQQCVMAAARSLKKKIEHYDEPFRLVISPRRGPWPVEIWVVSGRKGK